MSIKIIDYGVCNALSVKNMLNRIGFPCSVVKSPKEINIYDKLILPGIGSFDNGMNNLKIYRGLVILKMNLIMKKIFTRTLFRYADFTR